MRRAFLLVPLALALLAGVLLVPLGTTASAATLSARVTVNASQSRGTIPAAAFGINTAVYDSLMNDASIAGLMRSAGIGVMRYPGGSYGDIYHWQSHTAPGGFVAPGTTFDGFMSTVRGAGAQAMVIANYGTGTPQEAADWVRSANLTRGYNVRYWEIGNEVYGNGFYGAQWEVDNHADKSPAAYASNALQYINAMKAVDPTIKVGVVVTAPGFWPDGVVGPGSSADWNHTVLPVLAPRADFVVFHWYPGAASSSVADMLRTPSLVAGAVSQLRIRNTGGSAVNGWTLTWSFPGNQQITNMWNAVPTQTSQSVSARDATWNRTIAAGGTAAFGFQATYSGTNARPSAFTLNGTTCTIA
jgi:Cellulose binding domain